MRTSSNLLWKILTLVVMIIVGALFTLAVTAGPASAATGDPIPAQPIVAFTFDLAAVVQLVVAFIMPVLVGLATNRITSSGRKAIILATLTLITSLLVELGRSLEAGTTYDFGVALIAALPAFVVSVATHYGLWKPTGTAEAAQDALGGRRRADLAAAHRRV